MEKLVLKSDKSGNFFQLVSSYILGQPPVGTHEEWHELFYRDKSERFTTELHDWVYGKK